MKVLILDGSSEADLETLRMGEILLEKMQNGKMSFEWLKIRELNIAPCTGCFQCWTRTPGICVQKDDAIPMMSSWMSSKVVIFLTRITYGGYSNLLKRALDRQIGTLHPYYVSQDGDVQHMARYENYPSLLAFGVCSAIDQKESETFKRLVIQNGLTMRLPYSKSQVLCAGEKEESVREKIDSSLMGMKVGK